MKQVKSSCSSISPVSEASEMCKTDPNPSNRNEEALFDCCEIVLGNLLGTGAFCDVHDLYDVQLSSCDELDQRKSPIHQESEKWRRKFIRETCRDGTGKPSYVVKHLRTNLATDRGIKVFTHAAVDCLKEFDILSRLSHRNVVRLRGSAMTGRIQTNGDIKDYKKIVQENNPEAFFIVLEKLEETLSQRILSWALANKRDPPKCITESGEPLPPFYLEKLRYARDIASALAHIHCQGMVFRDLKPDNVGISSDGTAKLFDFGLCRDMPSEEDDESSSSSSSSMRREPLYRMSTVGTRRYMSPEMIRGDGYNQKTDSYSWALVFYEMIHLQKPYANYNRKLHEILVCEEQGRPHISTDVPWNAQDLLQRTWCDDVFDRLTMKETCIELDLIIETVKQQTLPLIERSLRAVLEMAELFEFGNDKTLVCLSDAGILPCSNFDDSEQKPLPYSSEENKESSTELSVSAAANRSAMIVAE